MGETFRLRADRLTWREVGGEVIALDLERSEYVATNASAGVLWPLLEAGARRDELIAQLCTRFGISEAAAATDVNAFLDALEGRGMVERL